MILQKTYQKPILLVGSGVRMAEAVDLVHAVVETTNMPLLTTMLRMQIS